MDVITINKHTDLTFNDNDEVIHNAISGDIDVDMESDENDDAMDADEEDSSAQYKAIVTPGELVTDDPVWMKGHGTYYLENRTYSSVAGTVSRVNRLLSVIPIRGRYQPETGDHVVGRITEVGQKRWKVDIGAKQDAVLMLGSVNLPGGVLRRKNEADELQMRTLLKEGDLLNAEVQSLFQDGSASLHTRSLKYGKLRNGVFLKVPSSLVVRSKYHSHDLPGGVSVILGVNGYVWLRKTSDLQQQQQQHSSSQLGKDAAALSSRGNYSVGNASVNITRLEEESSWEIYSDANDPIPHSIRETITRYANCIKILAHCEIGITLERVIACYEASMAYDDVGKLIDREVMETVGEDVITAEKYRA